MKKKIISQTMLFACILVFIIGFKSVFGDENILIGVTTVTAMLMFLSKDLTLNPVKNTLELVIFNVSMGIITYLASTNMFLAIPLNFISMFFIAYTLCYNLKSPSYIPFTLQYVFILAFPISADQLPKRLLSLAFGALSIMVIQLIANRNKVYKMGNKLLAKSCTSMLQKIRAIKNGESFEKIDNEIISSINEFRKIIYDKRSEHFYITEESRIKLNISLALEKLNVLLNDINKIKDDSNLEDLSEIEEDIIISIDNAKICFEDESNLENLDKLFNELLEKYKNKDTTNLIILKMLNSLHLLKTSLYELKLLDKKKYNLISKEDKIPEQFKIMNVYKKHFTLDSLRFSYAFRLGLGIAIGAFISDYFHLAEGRWIIFTIHSLVQPHYEVSKEKFKYRILSTFVGTAIIATLFYIFKDLTTRTMIIMLAGYLNGYVKQYKYSTIFVTISAIGSAALMGGTAVLSANRILFVIIGSIIGLILSKFVLQYRANDAKKDLIKMNNEVTADLLKSMEELMDGIRPNYNIIRNNVLVSTMIEEKLKFNNVDENNGQLMRYIDNQRLLVTNIYDLYTWLVKDNMNKDVINIVKNKDININKKIASLTEKLDSIKELNSKVILADYIEILNGVNNLNIFTI
ncbi:FUSC family protein [Clostridium botulinum]|uniref:FUSC family protein n=1 Tax=Clostridium TaxID=1485 RepID=UPI0005020A49|nr:MULTISPECIES: FUSC family protein [unclassified Clostridium]AIY79778.1 fusaric acid resistance -like family protein [Clostridium botulinum 202F]KAI3344852.1 FUSC family protein [Clostridium botulinum]KFX54417.1 membrane protein [Clostridium botulinum]KFX59257.1 membrane protein [Clostridium botulinum]KON11661.1 membrane protein [Clostridium botulinum]